VSFECMSECVNYTKNKIRLFYATGCNIYSGICCTIHYYQDGHKPGKPRILGDFSEHGKLREFCATSGENCNKLIVFS